MNTLKRFTQFLILALFFISCEEPTTAKEESTVDVTFGYSVQNETRTKSAVDKTPTAVILSIKDASGTVIHQSLKLPVQNFNGKIVTQPLPLKVGSYSLSEYKVLNSLDSVIYATPNEGSTAASLVSNPLPIEFSVTPNGSSQISPEVLDTETFTPEDFGYSTFGFRIVPTFHFLIGVNIYDSTEGKYILTSSNIEVKSGSHTDFNEAVSAETKTIEVRDFTDSVYTVTVTKDGYQTWSKTYTNTELKSYASLPLTVVLEQSSIQPFTKIVTNGSGNIVTLLPGSDNSVYSLGETSALNSRNVVLNKIDKDGNVEWYKIFGDSARNSFARNMIKLNSGIIIVGSRPNETRSYSEAWAIKVDFNGNTLWEKFYNHGLSLTDAIELSNGELVFIGGGLNKFIRTTSDGTEIKNVSLPLTTSNPPFYIISLDNHLIISSLTGTLLKTDYDGNIVWTETLASQKAVYQLVKLSETEFSTIQAGGYTSQYNRIDKDKNIIVSNKTLSFNDNMSGMILASNGSLMLCSSFYLHRMNLNGDLTWSKPMGVTGSRYYDSLVETQEKAIWIGGRTAQNQMLYTKTNLDGIK